MEDVLSNLPLEILQGNRMVEVRHRAVSKASVIEKVCTNRKQTALKFTRHFRISPPLLKILIKSGDSSIKF